MLRYKSSLLIGQELLLDFYEPMRMLESQHSVDVGENLLIGSDLA